jgi:hypothetical protein
MNIFEVVDSSGAVVHGNDELGFLITWNGSATFQWWNAKDINRLTFEVVDIRTAYNITSLNDAIKEASKWIESELASDEDGYPNNISR